MTTHELHATSSADHMTPRRLLKRLVFGASFVVASPVIFAAWLEKRLTDGNTVFAGASQLMALLPGRVGVYLRSAYYYTLLELCSWQIHIGFGSLFTHRAASLSSNVSMGAYCVIGHADIGSDVVMASRISIPSGKRQHLDESGRFSIEPRFERVAVGAGTWVGEGAIIMADVGAHCIVAAGAVVVDKMPPLCIVGGNPARVLRRVDLEGGTLSGGSYVEGAH